MDIQEETPVPSFNEVLTYLSEATGVSIKAVSILLGQLLMTCLPKLTTTPTAEWSVILSILCSFKIQNIQEAMLAIQMIAVHYHSSELLASAATSFSADSKEQYLRMAVRMSRLFNSQLEAFKKIRSKGEQKIVVEYVSVHNDNRKMALTVSEESSPADITEGD